MSEDNIWLAGRRQEHDALGRIILKLEHTRLADGTVRAVRGAGVDARTEAITGNRGRRLMRGNPDNLRRAAARKSAAAQARAEQGLREMIRRDEPITFRGLAQTAGVSLDFLYRSTADPPTRRTTSHPTAEHHRRRRPTTTHDDTPSSVVRTLTAQLAELKRRHRDEVDQLSSRRSKPPTARTSNYAAASAPNEPVDDTKTP